MRKKAVDSTVNAVRGLRDLPNSPCCPAREIQFRNQYFWNTSLMVRAQVYFL